VYIQARTRLARMAAKGAMVTPQVAMLLLVKMVEMVEMVEVVEVVKVLAACREAEQHWVAE
tara:strand:+ start:1966 stop:2148 length:183 start_codon:yes stop_codon:yes gene_type:complete